MTLRATVLIPTHNHGPTLRHAAESVLAQTARDLELFIVGDGVSDPTRDIAETLRRRDSRVRFFDNPKGPRHGEIHRHEALQEARGRIVCYLSDDDLYLPHHVESMDRLLADADFAHALSVVVLRDERLTAGNKVDFGIPGIRELFLSVKPRYTGVPLSCIAHTLESYRRLPVGWDTTPLGIATDIHMARKLVADPECRAVSGTRPTLLRFPSPKRRRWTLEQRADELEMWLLRSSDPAWLAGLPFDVLDAVVRADAAKFVATRVLKASVRANERRLKARLGAMRDYRAAERAAWGAERDARREQVIDLKRKLAEARARERARQTERADLRSALAESQARRGRYAEAVRALRESTAARLNRRVAALPIVGPILRAMARRAAKRSAP